MTPLAHTTRPPAVRAAALPALLAPLRIDCSLGLAQADMRSGPSE